MNRMNAHTQVHLEHGKIWHENDASAFCWTNSIEMGIMNRKVSLNGKVEHKTSQEAIILPYKVGDPVINVNMFIAIKLCQHKDISQNSTKMYFSTQRFGRASDLSVVLNHCCHIPLRFQSFFKLTSFLHAALKRTPKKHNVAFIGHRKRSLGLHFEKLIGFISGIYSVQTVVLRAKAYTCTTNNKIFLFFINLLFNNPTRYWYGIFSIVFPWNTVRL